MDALQQRTKAELKLFPTLESDPGALYHVWEFFPPSYNCPWDMQRVGLFGDGGKWVCGMSLYESATTRPLVVYSFGIAYESSFEQEILERTNAYIFGYDYTVDSFGPEITSDYQNRTIMKKFGIGSKDIPGDPPFFTLQSLMKQNNHSYIDILKMDIEGDELAVLTSFMDGFIGQQLPIGQVLIEIHLFQEHTTLKDFTIWWERLEEFGLRPVWAEANLLAVTYGGVLPCCTEYVFININDNKTIL
ncbi:major facilitator superfamily domain-containing 5 [Pyrenophora seminiperda CCB06]|uniref:Major facilitator superfamily domain-containing 5 n=1 Tax=Pyrenophora seminiperda CCB06 TaxID=1302712 RepID=A0A3M7M8I6_9PLEO|nr:major facilitator superfamily domain-containing 5 [Pyrenophora seminiperda CCB06]